MYNQENAGLRKKQAPDACNVVNYLLRRADNEGLELAPLQTIKLVYFCHGWQLGVYREPLIRQHVEAWQYGPVIPVVYRKLKKYGKNPITQPIGLGPRQTRPEFTEDQEQVMDQVFEKYHHFTGLQLSTLTHREGTPWHTIWSGPGKVMWEKTGENAVIPDKVIEDYFANWYRNGQP